MLVVRAFYTASLWPLLARFRPDRYTNNSSLKPISEQSNSATFLDTNRQLLNCRLL